MLPNLFFWFLLLALTACSGAEPKPAQADPVFDPASVHERMDRLAGRLRNTPVVHDPERDAHLYEEMLERQRLVQRQRESIREWERRAKGPR